jgi:hypothetical protein
MMSTTLQGLSHSQMAARHFVGRREMNLKPEFTPRKRVANATSSVAFYKKLVHILPGEICSF